MKKLTKRITSILLIIITFVSVLMINTEVVKAGTWDDAYTYYFFSNGGEPRENNGDIYIGYRNGSATGSGDRIYTVGLKITLPNGQNFDLALDSQFSNGSLRTVAGSAGQVKYVKEYPKKIPLVVAASFFIY